MLLGDVIRRLREAKGWTQGDLANAIGKKSSSNISTWESNKTKPQRASILKLNRVFGVDIEEYARTEGRKSFPGEFEFAIGPDGQPLNLEKIPHEILARLTRRLVQLNEEVLSVLKKIDRSESDYDSAGGEPEKP